MKIFTSKILWVALICAVVGWVWYQKSHKQEFAQNDIYTVTRADVVESVTVSGSLEPQKYANLAFGSAQLNMGEVTEVNVQVGDSVTKGDALVHIDNSVSRTQAYSAWKNARAQEELEKLARRRDWDDLKPEEKQRWKDLSAAARISASASSLTAAQSVLTAPFDGVVSVQNAIVGESVTAGTLVRVIDPQSLQIETLVSESDILNIAQGMHGVVIFDALPADETFDVVVNRIEPEATVVQDVVYYKVYFNMLQTTSKLRAGMSLDIDLILNQKHNVVVVPRRLVVEDAQGAFVMVLPQNQPGVVAQRRDIVVGLEGDNGMVEVVSGVHDGELIVSDNEK